MFVQRPSRQLCASAKLADHVRRHAKNLRPIEAFDEFQRRARPATRGFTQQIDQVTSPDESQLRGSRRAQAPCAHLTLDGFERPIAEVVTVLKMARKSATVG